MSVAAALAEMFSVQEITHPVRLAGAETRGILDEAGQLVPLAGTELQVIGTVLYLRKDSVPGIAQDASVEIGPLGAATVGSTPRMARLGRVQPIEDGLLLACECGGGR